MADAADYLPYLAEYAKSNRSSCKKCKVQIPKVIENKDIAF